MTTRFTSNLKAVKGELRKKSLQKAFTAANEIKSNWVKKLSNTGKGRVYKIPGTNVTYTASSPGDPPAVMLGNLKNSLQIKIFEEGGNVGYQIGSDLLTALWMEKGTSNILPRPSLEPAKNESLPTIKKIMEDRWF